MRRPTIALAFTLAFALTAILVESPAAQSPAGAVQAPSFRSSVDLVLVDVVVRDRDGAVVRDLKASDFELLEDGAPQQITSFTFEQIASAPAPLTNAPRLADATRAVAPASAGTPAPAAPSPMTAEDVAGRRLLVLLFDTSSMQPEDVQSALDAAQKWTTEQMSPADLVAVATISDALQIRCDFTADRARVQNALAGISAADGTGATPVDSSTISTDDAANAATDDSVATDASAQELDTFNNDLRLRALMTIANALAPIQQKKAVLYFSAGMQRSGTDNQVELRRAVNASVRANVSIYPVDARGLQAVVPGGSARNASRGGVGAFSGANVSRQFDDLAAQQETLHTLAADTGGTAFTDTNDFGDAFARAVKDTSAYYILGFSSSNPARDGRYRKLTVRLRDKKGLKVEARQGYYAQRDFAHTTRNDRETQLQEQLTTPLPLTDVPMIVAASWFRQSANQYYVPLSVAVPGSAVPPGIAKNSLDIAGVIRDERGAPVGRIRDSMTLPDSAGDRSLASRQVLYQTAVTLPPGRFTARVVVRENGTGQFGSFETIIVVPPSPKDALRLSSVVLSTQLRPDAKKSASPLVRDGVELIPNLTHIVGRDQTMYLYYELYDPGAEQGLPLVGTSLAFYRGQTKVFETPIVERKTIDAADRHAVLFQLEVPPGSLTPGLYTCQINVVDRVASRFAFPRLDLYVR